MLTKVPTELPFWSTSEKTTSTFWVLAKKKTVLIDGMPCLFLSPVLGMTSFGTFIQFLKHKVYNSFEHSNEIHVIFYVPSIWGFNLKKNTQSKRDSSKAHIQPLESSITDDTKVPSAFKWPSSLANWEDKQELVMYIGKKLLLAQKWLPLTRWCKACGWWMFSQQWDLHHLKAWY